MNEEDIKQLCGVHSGASFGFGFVFQPRPTVLYHYTDLSGFMGVIRSNQIWATDTRYLNDVTETQQIWSFLKDRVSAFQAQFSDTANVQLNELVRLAKAEEPRITFVSSFSEARDSLSQWRAYSARNGICLGFKEPSLNTQWVSNPKGGEPHWTSMLFHKVRYLPTGDNNSLDEELKTLLKHGSPFGSVSGYSASLLSWLNVLAVSFKHDAFKHEEEWRMCFQRFNKPMRYQRFREGKSMLIPYIAADLNRGTGMKSLVEGSYLEEIIIGPSANMQLTKTAVEQFLLAEGHQQVPVRLSAIPYRDW